MEPREYLVRAPDGHDHGRDPSRICALFTAIQLGDGAKVIALDELLQPILMDGAELVIHEVGVTGESDSPIPCPYRRCTYRATDENDLDEHLIATPTSAPEHWREDDDELPKRTPGMFVGQFPRE